MPVRAHTMTAGKYHLQKYNTDIGIAGSKVQGASC